MTTSLLQQNPWLRDPVKREAALRVSAASSSAIEGIRKPFVASGKLVIKSRKPSKLGG